MTAVSALALAAAALPDRGGRVDRERAATVALEPTTAAVASTPREVELTPEARGDVTRALQRFILTGVAGTHPENAWDLTTHALHAGSTKLDWARKETPFWRFPAKGTRYDGWVLKYSYPRDVGLDILLLPVARADTGPISFRAELKQVRGRWLVEAWQPVAMFSKPGEQSKVWAQPDLAPSQVAAGGQRLSANWLFLPLGLLVAAIVLIPGAIAVSGWRKNRAAVRYLREQRIRDGRAP